MRSLLSLSLFLLILASIGNSFYQEYAMFKDDNTESKSKSGEKSSESEKS